jgi:D-ribulokinase
VLGMALVERWGCDVLQSLGCPSPAVIRATGGTSTSAPFMQLRADVMGTEVEVPTEPSSAFGAAVVAAAGYHGSVGVAVDTMVSIATRYRPATGSRARWDDTYEAFRHRVRNGAALP